MNAQLRITGNMNEGFEDILTPGAIEFFTALETEFRAKRKELLERRKTVQKEIDAGKLPAFPEHTKSIRKANGKWLQFQMT